MSEARRVGKPPPELLEDLLKDAGGRKSKKLLVGPGAGLDAAVLDIGHGRVMAIAEDPIFPAPGLPLEMLGQFTVHIGASDVAVTGIRPQFMTYTLLAPGACSEEAMRTIIRSISSTADALGITIVGGHTGWYDAVTMPVIGGVTVWGTAAEDRWVSPGGARDGDVILMTKGPAIEACGLLSVLYKDKLKDQLTAATWRKLARRVDQISVVVDALTAFGAGGVHAMHDATEGGVLGGLWEMNAASRVCLRADLDAVKAPNDIAAFSAALGFDPWCAISEGTLLAAVVPEAVPDVRAALEKIGTESFVLGRFEAALKENVIRRDALDQRLPPPGVDPFWDLFFAGLSKA